GAGPGAVIVGGGGQDLILGGGGGDTIVGGTGNDLMYGWNGNDQLFGSVGNDTVLGGGGNDMVLGGAGQGALLGGAGERTPDAGTAGTHLLADTQTGGVGADEFVFHLNSHLGRVSTISNENSLEIKDYSKAAGDVFAVDDLVNGVKSVTQLSQLVKSVSDNANGDV